MSKLSCQVVTLQLQGPHVSIYVTSLGIIRITKQHPKPCHQPPQWRGTTLQAELCTSASCYIYSAADVGEASWAPASSWFPSLGCEQGNSELIYPCFYSTWGMRKMRFKWETKLSFLGHTTKPFIPDMKKEPLGPAREAQRFLMVVVMGSLYPSWPKSGFLSVSSPVHNDKFAFLEDLVETLPTPLGSAMN